MTVTLARCVVRGCPWRFTSGSDRPCAHHRGDDTAANLATRAHGFSVTMTAFDGGPASADDGRDGANTADGRGQAVKNRHGIAVR